MSKNTVEAFLHDISYKEGLMERFKADPRVSFADYPLSNAERDQLANWDVKAMADAGVSPMIMILSFMSYHGPTGASEYLTRLGLSPAAAALADAN